MTKKKISLDHIDHHDTKRMEFFLNRLEDELKEIPFNWKEMKMAEWISGACKFISTTNQTLLTITVYFCDSYAKANEIAKVNLLPTKPNARWSINGTLMYLVETEDEERLMDILGFFAGKE
jgi:hypothetical protein